MFICAGGSENFDFARGIGIGLVNSAVFLSNICVKEAPNRLIFIGSAGSYDNSVNIGDIFYSAAAYNIELSMLDSRSYTPIDNAIVMDSFINKNKKIFNIKDMDTAAKINFVGVNSSNYITSVDKYNDMFVKCGIHLENMEFFSVLSVARFYNIPAIGIFCVSNYVCKDSHAQFLQNQDLIKNRLSDFVFDLFKL